MENKVINGTKVDITWTYTGTKQSVGIEEVVAEKKGVIVGNYSITGQKLSKEPQTGVYIVKYSNGKAEKFIKK